MKLDGSMNPWSRWFCVSIIVLGLGFGECVESARANVLNEENFEGRELGSWKSFVTSNGTIGKTSRPEIVSFQTSREGEPSPSAQLKVGQVRYDPNHEPQQGGGLQFQVVTDAGTLDLSVHLAVSYQSPKDRRNLAGGVFEWIVDDQVVASHDVGPIKNHSVVRHHLQAKHPIEPGTHTIQIRVTRPFVSHPDQTAPYQYLDQLQVNLLQNP